MRELIIELPALTVAIPAISVALPVFSVLLLWAIFLWIFVPDKPADSKSKNSVLQTESAKDAIESADENQAEHATAYQRGQMSNNGSMFGTSSYSETVGRRHADVHHSGRATIDARFDQPAQDDNSGKSGVSTQEINNGQPSLQTEDQNVASKPLDNQSNSPAQKGSNFAATDDANDRYKEVTTGAMADAPAHGQKLHTDHTGNFTDSTQNVGGKGFTNASNAPRDGKHTTGFVQTRDTNVSESTDQSADSASVAPDTNAETTVSNIADRQQSTTLTDRQTHTTTQNEPHEISNTEGSKHDSASVKAGQPGNQYNNAQPAANANNQSLPKPIARTSIATADNQAKNADQSNNNKDRSTKNENPGAPGELNEKQNNSQARSERLTVQSQLSRASDRFTATGKSDTPTSNAEANQNKQTATQNLTTTDEIFQKATATEHNKRSSLFKSQTTETVKRKQDSDQPKYQTAAKSRHMGSAVEAQLQLKPPVVKTFSTTAGTTGNDVEKAKVLADKDRIIKELQSKLNALKNKQENGNQSNLNQGPDNSNPVTTSASLENSSANPTNRPNANSDRTSVSVAVTPSSSAMSATTDSKNTDTAISRLPGIKNSETQANQLTHDNSTDGLDAAANSSDIQSTASTDNAAVEAAELRYLKRQYQEAADKLSLREIKVQKLQSTVNRLQASGLKETEVQSNSANGRELLLNKVRVLSPRA